MPLNPGINNHFWLSTADPGFTGAAIQRGFNPVGVDRLGRGINFGGAANINQSLGGRCSPYMIPLADERLQNLFSDARGARVDARNSGVARLFDDVPNADLTTGRIDYRCIYVDMPDGATSIQITVPVTCRSSSTEILIGLPTLRFDDFGNVYVPVMPNESADPSYGGGIPGGWVKTLTINAPSGKIPLWIKRIVHAACPTAAYDGIRILFTALSPLMPGGQSSFELNPYWTAKSDVTSAKLLGSRDDGSNTLTWGDDFQVTCYNGAGVLADPAGGLVVFELGGCLQTYQTNDLAPIQGSLNESLYVIGKKKDTGIYTAKIRPPQAGFWNLSVDVEGGELILRRSMDISMIGSDSDVESTPPEDSPAYAPLHSPAFTGVPTALTAAPGTDTNQLATTAFANAAAQAAFSQAIPPGVIWDYAGKWIPAGWLVCDGRSLARTGTYANLFNAIGTVYGSLDGAHFNIPNTEGIFTRGAGGPYDRGSTGGEETHKLTTLEAGVGTHSHNLTGGDHVHSVTDAGHTHTFTQGSHTDYVDAGATTIGPEYFGATYGSRTSASATTGVSVDSTAPSYTVGDTGADATNAHENLPPYVTVFKIIKY